MHRRALGERNDAAHASIGEATKRLAERFGLEGAAEAYASVHDRNPEIKAMLQREVVAGILTRIAEAVEANDAEADADEKEPEKARLGCPYCERDYANNDTLRAHLQDKHAEEPTLDSQIKALGLE